LRPARSKAFSQSLPHHRRGEDARVLVDRREIDMHAASRRVEPDAGGPVEHASKVARDEATQRKGEVPATRRELVRACVQTRRETFARLQQRVNDVTEQRRPGELSDNAIEAARSSVGAAVRARTPERTEHLDALAQMFVSDVRARCEVKRLIRV